MQQFIEKDSDKIYLLYMLFFNSSDNKYHADCRSDNNQSINFVIVNLFLLMNCIKIHFIRSDKLDIIDVYCQIDLLFLIKSKSDISLTFFEVYFL